MSESELFSETYRTHATRKPASVKAKANATDKIAVQTDADSTEISISTVEGVLDAMVDLDTLSTLDTGDTLLAYDLSATKVKKIEGTSLPSAALGAQISALTESTTGAKTDMIPAYKIDGTTKKQKTEVVVASAFDKTGSNTSNTLTMNPDRDYAVISNNENTKAYNRNL